MSKQIERITEMEAALDDLTAVRAEFFGLDTSLDSIIDLTKVVRAI